MTSSSSPPLPSCAIGGGGGGDSPLSTTASIVGILTFALGLLASYIALQSATRGAPSEIARLVDDLRSTQREINRVAEYIFDDAHQRDMPPPPPPVTHFYGDGKMGEEKGGMMMTTKVMVERATSSTTSTSAKSKTSSNRTNTPPFQTPPPRQNPAISHLYTETQHLLATCIRLLIEADSLLKSVSSDSLRWDPEGLRRRVVFVMNHRHVVGEKMERLREQKEKLAGVQMSLFMRKSAVQEGVMREMSRRLGVLEERVGGIGKEGEG